MGQRPAATGVRALAEAGAIRGRVLDVGCGTGEHTLMSTAIGLDATGIDLASNALHTAQAKARDRGLTARFRHQDAGNLAALEESPPATIDVTTEPDGIRVWLVALTRI